MAIDCMKSYVLLPEQFLFGTKNDNNDNSKIKLLNCFVLYN